MKLRNKFKAITYGLSPEFLRRMRFSVDVIKALWDGGLKTGQKLKGIKTR